MEATEGAATRPGNGVLEYGVFLDEGRHLARADLALIGAEAELWAYQYADACKKAVTARIRGDGETFTQALAFPLVITPERDFVLPVEGQALHIVVELPHGMLIYFKRLGHSRVGIRLGEFLSRIQHCFYRSTRSTVRLAELERCCRTAIARRLVFRDFPLDRKGGAALFGLVPDLPNHLAPPVFAGFSGLPHLGKKSARMALANRMAEQFDRAHAAFVAGLRQEVLTALDTSGEGRSILAYNNFLIRHIGTDGYRMDEPRNRATSFAGSGTEKK